ncbi:hypothetical protein AYI69_g6820 [Smittium culicis]|uniref:B box-type domain-containing protein n=1 Tax=Smittium culicis TaxID=133412 RepID=A0A1R1XW99_9FUNG|nr:hypothetical protein AYI69_g6820 [Smittium culicis]
MNPHCLTPSISAAIACISSNTQPLCQKPILSVPKPSLYLDLSQFNALVPAYQSYVLASIAAHSPCPRLSANILACTYDINNTIGYLNSASKLLSSNDAIVSVPLLLFALLPKHFCPITSLKLPIISHTSHTLANGVLKPTKPFPNCKHSAPIASQSSLIQTLPASKKRSTLPRLRAIRQRVKFPKLVKALLKPIAALARAVKSSVTRLEIPPTTNRRLCYHRPIRPTLHRVLHLPRQNFPKRAKLSAALFQPSEIPQDLTSLPKHISPLLPKSSFPLFSCTFSTKLLASVAVNLYLLSHPHSLIIVVSSPLFPPIYLSISLLFPPFYSLLSSLFSSLICPYTSPCRNMISVPSESLSNNSIPDLFSSSPALDPISEHAFKALYHIISRPSSPTMPPLPPEPSPQPKHKRDVCEFHSLARLEYWCLDCSAGLCEICLRLQDRHRSHLISSLASEYDRCFDLVDAQIENTLSLAEDIASHIDNFDSDNESLINNYQFSHDLLSNYSQTLFDSLKLSLNDHQQNIKLQQASLTNYCLNLHNQIDSTQTLMETYSRINVVENFHSIISSLSALSLPNNIPPIPNYSPNFSDSFKPPPSSLNFEIQNSFNLGKNNFPLRINNSLSLFNSSFSFNIHRSRHSDGLPTIVADISFLNNSILLPNTPISFDLSIHISLPNFFISNSDNTTFTSEISSDYSPWTFGETKQFLLFKFDDDFLSLMQNTPDLDLISLSFYINPSSYKDQSTLQQIYIDFLERSTSNLNTTSLPTNHHPPSPKKSILTPTHKISKKLVFDSENIPDSFFSTPTIPEPKTEDEINNKFNDLIDRFDKLELITNTIANSETKPTPQDLLSRSYNSEKNISPFYSPTNNIKSLDTAPIPFNSLSLSQKKFDFFNLVSSNNNSLTFLPNSIPNINFKKPKPKHKKKPSLKLLSNKPNHSSFPEIDSPFNLENSIIIPTSFHISSSNSTPPTLKPNPLIFSDPSPPINTSHSLTELPNTETTPNRALCNDETTPNRALLSSDLSLNNLIFNNTETTPQNPTLPCTDTTPGSANSSRPSSSCSISSSLLFSPRPDNISTKFLDNIKAIPKKPAKEYQVFDLLKPKDNFDSGVLKIGRSFRVSSIQLDDYSLESLPTPQSSLPPSKSTSQSATFLKKRKKVSKSVRFPNEKHLLESIRIIQPKLANKINQKV